VSPKKDKNGATKKVRMVCLKDAVEMNWHNDCLIVVYTVHCLYTVRWY
jgi:hypothetical protein